MDFWVTMLCQCRFIDYKKKKKSATVLWVVHSWGDCACVRQGYTGTFYSAQICCKPKTALKNKPYRKLNVFKRYARRVPFSSQQDLVRCEAAFSNILCRDGKRLACCSSGPRVGQAWSTPVQAKGGAMARTLKTSKTNQSQSPLCYH